MDYKDLGTVEPLNESQELAWDGTIVAESEPKEYVLLPEGDYAFTVEKFDKQRFIPKKPDSKIPECWAAVVHLNVYPHQSDADPVPMQSRLFLHSVQEWKLSEFFLAIGQKKHGEPLRMNWSLVPGAQGYLHVNHREYNGKRYNNVQHFIDPARVKPEIKAYYEGSAAAPAVPAFNTGSF